MRWALYSGIISGNAYIEALAVMFYDTMDSYTVQVERLKNLVTSASTDLTIEVEHELEYGRLRQSLLGQDRFKRFAPQSLIQW